MLFVDASIIVAVLASEPDADELIDRLERSDGEFLVSPIVRMEAALSLARRLAAAAGREKPASAEMLARARELVDQFIADIAAKNALITGEVGEKALDAAQAFGKIVGHPARLNMGDCYSYACAKAYRTKIAFKGDDFSHTDLGW